MPHTTLEEALKQEAEWKRGKFCDAISAMHVLTAIPDLAKHVRMETQIAIQNAIKLLLADSNRIDSH